MKKQEILSCIRLFLMPVLVILLGLILIINPDSATAFISRVLGGILILIAVAFGISAIAESSGRTVKSIVAVVMAVVGGWLVQNPLALAAWLGRFVGVVLIIDSLQDITELRHFGKTFRLPLILAILGVVLVVMPMTTSRLVFSLCGVAVLIIGAVMLLDRLRNKPRLQSGDDIIDAE